MKKIAAKASSKNVIPGGKEGKKQHSDGMPVSLEEKRFYAEVLKILTEGRNKAHAAVNFAMVETYWNIGKRIVEQEQQGKERANYGEYLFVNLLRYLTDVFGKGFTEANIRNMRQFYHIFPDLSQFATHCVANLSWTNIRIAETFPYHEIVVSLIRQLRWTHIIALIPIGIRFV
jgi:hypothetical protein